MFVKT